jgi:phosphoribosylformylglycinamidine synthase
MWDSTAAKPERGLAMALAGNGRWTYLDPKLGAMHAVAEAARKVACTGATPVAATNCLNFGNPEKPEIMAQLSAAIDGIAEACTALGTPVTGGNVSLYNETKGEGIYPTPVIGVVGILDDVTKAVPSAFEKAGDAILLLQGPSAMQEWKKGQIAGELGATDFAKSTFGVLWGRPHDLDLRDEKALHAVLQTVAREQRATSMTDISDGGLAVALAKASFPNNVGPSIFPSRLLDPISTVFDLFGEFGSSAILSCDPKHIARIEEIAEAEGVIFVQHIGDCVAGRFVVELEDAPIDIAIADLFRPYSDALESQLAAEVVA